MSIFSELRRRNVIRVGVAYCVTAWLVLQVTSVVAPILELPGWVPKLVLTLLAIGLFPALVFAWAFELTPDGLKLEKYVDRSDLEYATTGRKLDFIIIGVLAMAVAMLLVDRMFANSPDVAVSSDTTSIAVLPFVNMSSDSEQEYFSDGITEEILNALSTSRELRVAGRTSSFAFKGKNDDLRRIGESLGVDHILEGSVRKSGSKIRITAQLIRVDDGFHQWSGSYDRELTDVFAIQEEIAERILKELRATLIDQNLVAVELRRTSPAVYDLYLLARQKLYDRTQSAIQGAAELLDQAITIDRTYAPAWAQRGIAAILLSNQIFGTLPDDQARGQGKEFIDRALALDANLAEAWAGLGLYYLNRPAETDNAVAALTKALQLNPNLIDASNWLYTLLFDTGDIRAALEVLEDITRRDPLYRPAFFYGVATFNSFGMIDRAEALIDRFAAFNPNDPLVFQARAVNCFFRGDAAAGYPWAEKAIELAPNDNEKRFAWSIALLQLLQIDQLISEGQKQFRADALDATGRREEAFEVARELADDGFLDPLFVLLNRSGQSAELVAWVEQRWPNLAAFDRDYKGDGAGDSLMGEIAYAYIRTGDQARAREALKYVDAVRRQLTEQGVDNFIFMTENARYYTLVGNHDAAIDWLGRAIDRGLQNYAPLSKWLPAFSLLEGDPRFAELEARMIDNINEDRAALGMAPIDPYREFWQ